MADAGPRSLLTSTTNSFEARVIEARLRSEGLDPELRGALGGPYPFTVGGMGEVSVHVPDEQLDDARLVLLAGEVDSSMAPASATDEPMVSEPPGRSRTSRSDLLVAAAVLAVVVVVTVTRLARLVQ